MNTAGPLTGAGLRQQLARRAWLLPGLAQTPPMVGTGAERDHSQFYSSRTGG